MIPKIIYTTWVSDKPLPEKFNKYIDTWKEKLPDYEIITLSMDNIPHNEWIDKAIDQKKFILAGHYARCQRIYETGGIYFDVDIEVVKSFDDLLDNKMFIGSEEEMGNYLINNAVYGAEKGHPLMKECMEYMDSFDINHPEVENETGPRMFTKLIKERGWQQKPDNQLVGDIQVYSPKYFYPYSWEEEYTPECITEETYTVHHWAHSWNNGVSIIIPCFNQAEFLAECIESCLAQTVKPQEIIVVNDGSTDNCGEVAKRYEDKGVIYIEKENGGVSSARNAGIAASKGKYILTCDADDQLEPTFLERTIGIDDIVSTALQTFGAYEMIWTPPLINPKHSDFLQQNNINCGSLFLREIWEKIGGNDENMRDGYEDWDFWVRATKAGYSVTVIPEPLFRYRKYDYDRSDRQCSVDRGALKDAEVKEYMYRKYSLKKILFVGGIPTYNGVTYYRLMNPIKALSTRGHEIKTTDDFVIVDKRTGQLSFIPDDFDWADVVVFPRYFTASPNAIVTALEYCKENGKRVIWETDDYLDEIPEHNPLADTINAESVKKMVEYFTTNADEKTVTTRKLQEHYGGVICPNSVDFTDWGENQKTDKLRVGWSGGWTHKKDLEMIIPVLKKLKKKYNFELFLFGYDPEFSKRELYYKFAKFVDVRKYPEKLASLGFDIGIAPLIEDEFNQYKSNIKWLEYSTLKIPTVATNLPPYEGIEHGVTGFLCSTLEEWEESLSRLLEDAEYRKKIGEQAYEHVKENYDIHKTVERWEEAYIG